MSTLTKEWLLTTIAELEEERDATPGAVNEDASMALAAMKLALASLEAEAVADVVAWSSPNEERTCDIRMRRHDIKPGSLYTAPPAPEFYKIGDATMRHIFTPTGITDVSDMQAVFDQIETVLAGMWQPAPVSVPDAMDGQGGVCCEVSYADGWNSCRAAMLQGADGNAPAHFRSRPAQSSLSPAQGGNSPVIPDGWVAVPVEPTEDMIVNGFESEPDESFSDEKEWEAYDAMSGCQQAAHRARLCWSAMIASRPKLKHDLT
ncbi:hypothetical protein ACRN86_001052 [Enterobacter hormaechei]